VKRRGGPGLVPLGDPGSRAEARLEARLRGAWLLVVGPALVNQTRLLRAHRGILLVGCWHPEVIPSLRRSVEAIWPQLRERLERMWHLPFQCLEIVPCDPPPPPAPPAGFRADPLKEVLRVLRERGKGDWTRRPG
jgi:hypothetical protein